MTEGALLELKNVSFSAVGKTIVNGVSLAYAEGETVALVGPSGGGKSTVLKLTAGLIVPTEGIAAYRGAEIAAMNRQQNLAFRREASFVFQDSALWANQSIRQIMEIPLKTHFPEMDGAKRNERVRALLAESGYRRDLDIRPADLSMGEQKLVAFSRAMACDPTILFLDEWTESLDEIAAKRLVNLVKKRKDAGKTVVFVSHNFAVIKELADRIVMIVDGRVSLSVTREEFANDTNLAHYIEQGIAL